MLLLSCCCSLQHQLGLRSTFSRLCWYHTLPSVPNPLVLVISGPLLLLRWPLSHSYHGDLQRHRPLVPQEICTWPHLRQQYYFCSRSTCTSVSRWYVSSACAWSQDSSSAVALSPSTQDRILGGIPLVTTSFPRQKKKKNTRGP